MKLQKKYQRKLLNTILEVNAQELFCIPVYPKCFKTDMLKYS